MSFYYYSPGIQLTDVKEDTTKEAKEATKSLKDKIKEAVDQLMNDYISHYVNPDMILTYYIIGVIIVYVTQRIYLNIQLNEPINSTTVLSQFCIAIFYPLYLPILFYLYMFFFTLDSLVKITDYFIIKLRNYIVRKLISS